MTPIANAMTLAQSALDSVDPNTIAIGSVGMVALVTMAIVSYAIKPLLKDVPRLQCVPLVVYTALVAVLVTVVANKLLKQLPGDNVWVLAFRSVVSTLAAAGIFKFPSSLQPLADTAEPDPDFRPDPAPTDPDPKLANSGGVNSTPRSLALLLLLPMLAVVAGGCQAPTTSPFYNGVSAQWPPIRDTYDRYVNADATLTPDQRAILLESSKTMDALVDREGQRLRNAAPATTQP